MKRAWFAVALLSAGWLFGLHLFQPPNSIAWSACVIVATLLLADCSPVLGRRWECALAALLLLPAAVITPWPHGVALLLLVVGLALLAANPVRWVASVAWGSIQAGIILYVQQLALTAYVIQTGRGHELPQPVATVLAALLQLAGIDAAARQSTIVFQTTRQVHPLAATWELLAGPGMWCFLAGGLALLLLRVGNCAARSHTDRWQLGLTAAQRLVLVLLLWIPVRIVLLVALYVHRVVVAEPLVPLVAMNQFLSAWVHLLCLLSLAALAALVVRVPVSEGSSRKGLVAEDGPSSRACNEPGNGEDKTSRGSAPSSGRPAVYRIVPALLGIGLATGLSAFSAWWEPIGTPRGGRVMFVERHSTWEPSDRPYDTEHFGHDPSYSYTLAYRYLAQYFQMDRLRESEPIDRNTLSRCDVLVVKIPTEAFLPEEVDAIEAFVRSGGGLLLVGDHTNVFNSSSYLNPIAGRFGFVFRHDLLFCIGSPYDQPWRPPLGAHPAVQHVPPMYFAVSCSIDPARSRGRAVIRNTGLWNLPPEIHADNYHPEAEYRPDMQYGAFIQAWSTRYGNGRVLAFADSTIFSNFCVFQPGKAELLRGMVDWLNRTSLFDRMAMRLLVVWSTMLLAAAAFGFGVWLAVREGIAWPPLFGAAVCGASLGLLAAVGVHRAWMPPPRVIDPMFTVAIDRTCSRVPLSRGAFTQGNGSGYGLLEQWIPRLGYMTRRTRGAAGFHSDMIVVICPNQSVPESFRRGLVDYVSRGGRLLVIDSPDNFGTTVNSLLWPFGLESIHATATGGKLRSQEPWPNVEVTASCEIRGGRPLLWIDQLPVAAEARLGKGRVIAVGFGLLWNDASMGGEWSLVPEETTLLRSDVDRSLLERYDLLFAFLRALGDDQPFVPFVPPEADSSSPSP